MKKIETLRSQQAYVLWERKDENDKKTGRPRIKKEPKNPRDFAKRVGNTPAWADKWLTYEDCKKELEKLQHTAARERVGGMMVTLRHDTPLAILEIDRHNHDEETAEEREIINALKGRAIVEQSVSGKGLHFYFLLDKDFIKSLCATDENGQIIRYVSKNEMGKDGKRHTTKGRDDERGTVQQKDKCYKNEYNENGNELEVYIGGIDHRFFVIDENKRVSDLTADDLSDCTDVFKPIYKKFFEKKKNGRPRTGTAKSAKKNNKKQETEDDPKAWAKPTDANPYGSCSLRTVIKNACQLDPTLNNYFYGRTGAEKHNDDESAADMRLAGKLAYWLNGNAQKVAEAFRLSERAKREKLQNRAGGSYDLIESVAAAACRGIDRTAADTFETHSHVKEDMSDINECFGGPNCEPVTHLPRLQVVKHRTEQNGLIKEGLDAEAVARYLVQIGVKLRYNDIARRIEVETNQAALRDPHTGKVKINAAAILPDLLVDAFKPAYTASDRNHIAACLSLIADSRRFNPVLEMLNLVKWDNVDRLNGGENQKGEHVKGLYEIMNIKPSDTLSRVLIKKWLIQCIALQYNGEDLKNIFGADGVLTLNGPQGIGKTRLVEVLGINHDLTLTGAHLDKKDKDTVIQSTGYFIAELGEVETTFKSDIEWLKGFLTAREDIYRAPYEHTAERHPRHTSYIATCNTADFLIDTTGNRRFWTVPLDRVDLEALNHLDVLQMWRQVKTMYDNAADKQAAFRLTQDEQRALLKRNSTRVKLIDGQAEVMEILAQAHNEENIRRGYVHFECMTAAHFAQEWADKLGAYSTRKVGRALIAAGVPVAKRAHNLNFYNLPRWNGNMLKADLSSATEQEQN